MGKAIDIRDYLANLKTPRTVAQIGNKFGISDDTVKRYLRDKQIKASIVKDESGKVAKYSAVVKKAETKKSVTKKPATTKATSTPKVEIFPIEMPALLDKLVGSIYKSADLATVLNIPEESLRASIEAVDANKDVHLLVAQVGTTYYTIWSTAPDTNYLEFKNSTFSRKSNSRVWNELSEEYVRKHKWTRSAN